MIALGHRAVGATLPEQKTALKAAAKAIVDIAEQGVRVAVVFTAAPQIGMIHQAMNELHLNHPEYTKCPMSICSAMAQGFVGYDLQKSVRAELLTRGLTRPVASVVTQVLVDPYDEAFYKPTRAFGRVLTREEADAEEKSGKTVTRSDDGYRRVVAAPVPREIIELETIRTLLENDHIVICCGGGGIPVIEQGVDLRGASALIDKDLVSGLLAVELEADDFMILTSVDEVSLNYKMDNERVLTRISSRQAASYCEEDRFEAGMIRQKFEAAINFVDMGRNRRAIITSVNRAKAAYAGMAGTTIVAAL